MPTIDGGYPNRAVLTGDERLVAAAEGRTFGLTTGALRNYITGVQLTVDAFGAVGDGVTDDTAAFQDAIDAVAAAGGGTIMVPWGQYRITDTLYIAHGGVQLRGSGFVKDQYSRNSDLDLDFMDAVGTALVWGGTSGIPMVHVGWVSGTTTRKVSGSALCGIALNGMEAATTGILVLSADRCVFDDVLVQKCTGTGVLLTTDAASQPFSGARDTQNNIFNNLFIEVAGSARGIVLASDVTAVGNSSVNTFSNVFIRYANGDAVTFEASDSNTFFHLRCTRLTGDTGLALRFVGAVAGVVGYARTNFIYHFHSSQGGILAEAGDGSNPSVDNAVFGANMDGGAVNIPITVEPTARFTLINPRLITRQALQNLVAFGQSGTYSQANSTSRTARDYFEDDGPAAINAYAGSGLMLKLYNPSSGTQWSANVGATGITWTGPDEDAVFSMSHYYKSSKGYRIGSKATASQNLVLGTNDVGSFVVSKGDPTGTLEELFTVVNTTGRVNFQQYDAIAVGATITTAQLARDNIGASSLAVANGASAHMRLIDPALNEWSINIDSTTGNLRVLRNSSTGIFDVAALAMKVEVVTAATKVLNDASSVLLVDAADGARTVTLPLASSYGAARTGRVTIRRIDASGNTVTVQCSGADTLNGAASETLAAGQARTYVCDAVTRWFSI